MGLTNDELSEQMHAGFTSLHIELAEVKRTAESARDQAIATNGRVTVLERWKWYMDGVKAGAGGLWQYAVAILGVAATILAIVTTLTRSQ